MSYRNQSRQLNDVKRDEKNVNARALHRKSNASNNKTNWESPKKTQLKNTKKSLSLDPGFPISDFFRNRKVKKNTQTTKIHNYSPPNQPTAILLHHTLN
jgi:hypothetical protein